MTHKITLDKENPKFEIRLENGYFTGIILEKIHAAEVPEKETGYISICAINATDVTTNKFKGTNVFVQRFVSLPMHCKGHVFNMDLLAVLKEEADRQGKKSEFNKLLIRPAYDFLETGNLLEIVFTFNKTGSYVTMEPAHLF